MSANDGSQTVVGASTHPDLERAITKAVIEAGHGWVWACELKRSFPPPVYEEITDFKHHVRYYLERETQTALAFLKAEGRIFRPQLRGRRRWTHAEIANHGVNALRAIGQDVYAYNHTRDDLRSLSMHAIRVVVPGLHPLSAGTAFTCLDERRLRAVGKALCVTWPGALNPAPHPFP